MSAFLQVIGDEIFCEYQVVAKITVPEGTLRDTFIERLIEFDDLLEGCAQQSYDEGVVAGGKL